MRSQRLDGIRRVGHVAQAHAHFAAVVAVDYADAVGRRDSMPARKAAARKYEYGVAVRNFQHKPRRNLHEPARRDRHRLAVKAHTSNPAAPSVASAGIGGRLPSSARSRRIFRVRPASGLCRIH